MYWIAICDSSRGERLQLQDAVTEATKENKAVIELFKNGQSLIERCQTGKFDVVIIADELKNEDSIKVAEQVYMMDYDVQIVFVGNNLENAYKAYNVPHLWYVKTCDIDTLMRNVLCRAKEIIKRRTNKRIEIRSGGKSTFVPADRILYFEQNGRKMHIVTEDGEYDEYGKVSERESESCCFVQCHKSYLVNIRHVTGATRTQLFMSDGKVLPVSRTFYSNVRDRLKNCETVRNG